MKKIILLLMVALSITACAPREYGMTHVKICSAPQKQRIDIVAEIIKNSQPNIATSKPMGVK